MSAAAASAGVRVAINTGEALVALGAHPERGEGLVTGDVVNTASRLQGIAPVNGVAVSEPAFHQTERVFTLVRLTDTRLMVMLLRDCSGHSPTFVGTRTLQAL